MVSLSSRPQHDYIKDFSGKEDSKKRCWRYEGASMRQREREEKLTSICTSIDAWPHLCVCVCVCVCVFVCVYTHVGTLYSKLQACRLELYQGGTEVVGRKYSRTPLCHSVGGKHTYTIIINKRASQLHRFCIRN